MPRAIFTPRALDRPRRPRLLYQLSEPPTPHEAFLATCLTGKFHYTPERITQLVRMIIRTATAHNVRSRAHPIHEADQFAWAVHMASSLGCISSQEGLDVHATNMTAQEAEAIRYAYIYYSRVFDGWTCSPIDDRASHLSRMNALLYRGEINLRGLTNSPMIYINPREAWLTIDGSPILYEIGTLPAIFSPTVVDPFDGLYHTYHNGAVEEYESFIARERAQELNQRRNFVRLDGEPRTSTKSVLYSRWNRQ